MHTLCLYLELAWSLETRRPLVGSLVGRIPESIVAVSLILVVRRATGSYASAGIAAAGFALGAALAAPVAGRALDRLAQPRLLVGLAICFGTALVAIVITAGIVPVALTIALAAAAGVARPPLDAAVRALWPRVLPPDRLQAAYSLDATLQELIWIVGPLLLSALLLLGGLRSRCWLAPRSVSVGPSPVRAVRAWGRVRGSRTGAHGGVCIRSASRRC